MVRISIGDCGDRRDSGITNKMSDPITSAELSDMSNDELEHAAPCHNREWCTCPYCEELRLREPYDERSD